MRHRGCHLTMPVAEPCVYELVEVSCTSNIASVDHVLAACWWMIHQPANVTRQVTRSTRSARTAVSNASAAAAEVD